MAERLGKMTTSVEDFFDRRSATYDQDVSSAFHAELVRRLIANADLAPGQSVLDVATGTGLAAVSIARRMGGRGEVVGIDISARMLERAKQNATKARIANVRFLRMSGDHLDGLAAQFDRIFCSAGLSFMSDQRSALAAWKRALAPDGLIAFDAPASGSTILGSAVAEQAAAVGIQLGYARLLDEQDCRELVEQVGLRVREIRMETFRSPDFALHSFDRAWAALLRHPLSSPLTSMRTDQLEDFKSGVWEKIRRTGVDPLPDEQRMNLVYATH